MNSFNRRNDAPTYSSRLPSRLLNITHSGFGPCVRDQPHLLHDLARIWHALENIAPDLAPPGGLEPPGPHHLCIAAISHYGAKIAAKRQ